MPPEPFLWKVIEMSNVWYIFVYCSGATNDQERGVLVGILVGSGRVRSQKINSTMIASAEHTKTRMFHAL